MSEVMRYKGYDIKYRENRDIFYAEDDDGNDVLEKPTIPLLKKAIDAHRKKKFERVGAFQVNGEFLRKCTVTSISPDGDIWISYKEDGTNHREKVWRKHDLYVDNTHNRLFVTRYNDIQKKINKLAKEQSAILNKMENYKPAGKK